jgi:FkbM family methyltransferase
LTEAQRQTLLEELTAPRPLRIDGSNLRLHVHSVTEDARIRKFKEPWTIAWLRRLPSDAVLYDVGANIGITALVAAESVEGVKVVAFEPFPANFASLVKNIQANGLGTRVAPLAIGLGHETAVRLFNWVSSEPGGSLHSFGEIVQLSHTERIAPIGSHYCLCYRLDDLVRLPGLPFPSHMKIDVDGGELDVLAGAATVVADPKCQGLQVEVVDPDASRQRSREVTTTLSSAGLSLVAEFAHGESYPRVLDLQFERQ